MHRQAKPKGKNDTLKATCKPTAGPHLDPAEEEGEVSRSGLAWFQPMSPDDNAVSACLSLGPTLITAEEFKQLQIKFHLLQKVWPYLHALGWVTDHPLIHTHPIVIIDICVPGPGPEAVECTEMSWVMFLPLKEDSLLGETQVGKWQYKMTPAVTGSSGRCGSPEKSKIFQNPDVSFPQAHSLLLCLDWGNSFSPVHTTGLCRPSPLAYAKRKVEGLTLQLQRTHWLGRWEGSSSWALKISPCWYMVPLCWQDFGRARSPEGV